MKNIFFTITLLILVWSVNSQNRFFIGDKSFLSTESLEMGEGFMTPISLIIAKDGNKGIIAVTKESLGNKRILNTLIIYLEDGTLIKCIDRNIFDIVNNKATTVYYLTSKEIEKLKKTNIHSIRYDFGFDKNDFFTDSFSVENSYPRIDAKINFPRKFKRMF